MLVGMLAGLVGGLIGSWAMNQVGPAIQYLRRATGVDDGGDPEKKKSGEQRASGTEDDSATVRVARVVSRTTLGRDLPRGSEPVAGNAVHFAFGAVNGAWYGAMAEVSSLIARGRGLLFGTLIWAGADEAVLPALGLSPPPVRYPLSTHAESLTTHFVYGLTTDTVRRLIRRALS